MSYNEEFDPKDFESCVRRAILLIRSRESQMKSEGYVWPFETESLRWNIEQEIINRSSTETMMFAAIRYVESVESRAEAFNNL